MKILLVSSDDPKDRNSWSGTSKSIYSVMHDSADILVSFHSSPKHMRFLSNSFSALFRRSADFYKTKIYAKYLARKVQKIIGIEKPDLIVGVVATVELAYVKTNIPIIHISDATYMNLYNYYNKYLKVWDWSKKSANSLEQQIINNADLIILPSTWARKSVINDYHCSPEKIKVIPFGANLPTVPQPQKKAIVGLDKPCKLLFIGVDWERKGGGLAFSAMQNLRGKGIDATLQVIGCLPSSHIKSPHMSVKRFLNKQDPKEYQELVEHLSNSTFLFVPTQAEAFGIVFAEAAMFGLPSISHRTGGVESVIDQDKTGHLLPIGSTGNDFAKAIENIIEDDQKYQEMAKNSFKKYQEQLNWQAWHKAMNEIIHSHMNTKTRL